MYDSIVVGGGHAGVEAANALSKMNKKVLLITGNLEKVASLPCNPSIGGPAKGVVVREIDALGGIQGVASDKTQIQMKLLNASKGPAVRAYRVQLDKQEYPKTVLSMIKELDNLELLEEFVNELIIEDNKVKGVILENGTKIYSKTVIITTGTYLNSAVLKGLDKIYVGPDGDKTTKGISSQLKAHNFEVLRLKTGTPMRLNADTIDFSLFAPQPGADKPYTFSHDANDFNEQSPNIDCYLLHTNSKTHQIINENLHLSSMYSGHVVGSGPRYCPSIEDKIVRFNTQPRHQIFLEPESLHTKSIYVQGLSTSFPDHIQDLMIKSLPGLENAEILKYGYAIEYDAINPTELYPSLETKKLENLFCAGQINGTSGYEEAAGQGIMAGINAGLKVDNKKPFVLGRDEAYIGVMIDDLVTKGVTDPYRLLTSRSEYRMFIRNDNADLRLTDYGYQYGVVSEERYQQFLNKKANYEMLVEELENTDLMNTDENNSFLESKNSSLIYSKIKLFDLLKRPEMNIFDLTDYLNNQYDEETLERAEIHVKYDGYVQKAKKNAEKVIKLDSKEIPNNINYQIIKNLSLEGMEKLEKIRPKTIGQASRIMGVKQTDIQLLLIYIESGRRANELSWRFKTTF